MIFLFRQINSQKGFSIVQVLIAAALTGGLGLVLMQISSMQSDISIRGQSALDEQEALSRLRNLLSNPKNCKESLYSLGPFRRSLVLSNGLNVQLKKVDFNGNSSVAMSASEPFNKFGRFEIEQMRLLFQGTAGNYPPGKTSDSAIVKIDYSKKNGKSSMQKSFKTEINILVDTVGTNSRIVECGTESRFMSVKSTTVIYNHYSGYVNNFDNKVEFRCPGNKVMYGEVSYHSDSAEDRRHAFRCADVRLDSQNLSKRNCQWSGYVNGMDGNLNYQCPNNTVLDGHFSYHDNGAEDRVYQFSCCDLGSITQTVKLDQCSMSGWINGWDDSLDFRCPTGRVKVGEQSIHSNHYEDRIYRFKCCAVVIQDYQ